MKLAHYGEDRLIAELTRSLSSDHSIRIGIGDDCAVIGKKGATRWQLLKTDCLVENVHFLPETAPRRIGWKALARAISDIAAMGGLPRYALITLAVSPEVDVRRLKGIYSGLKKAADRFNIRIVGGETSSSPGPLFISIALTGEVESNYCITRSGGRVGDLLYVTGKLGGSIRGHHLDFLPRVEEARWLVENFRLRAMMDLSDGLAADLPRIAAASKTGFEIFENQLPCNKACSAHEALTDGEDYELLFAIAPRQAASLESKWLKRFPKLALTCVGRLTAHAQSSFPVYGFDHFA